VCAEVVGLWVWDLTGGGGLSADFDEATYRIEP
jgi:hypothetical protein